MKAVVQAVEEYRAGGPITARCPVCDDVLQVTVNEEIGSTWVVCPKGCTNAHLKWHPQGK